MAVLTIHKRLRALSLLSARSYQTLRRQEELIGSCGADLHLQNGKRAAFFVYTVCSRVRSHRTRETVLSNRIATLGLATDTAFRFQNQRSANIRDAGDGTTLFLTLWEFEVKSGCEELFERAYGPEGEWVRLFRRDARDRGTRLVRYVGRERVYLTMDMWEAREAYEEFREKYATEYAEIDGNCKGLTEAENHFAEMMASEKEQAK